MAQWLLAAFMVGLMASNIFAMPYLAAQEKVALRNLFESQLSPLSDDLAAVHHAVAGLKLLGIKQEDVKSKALCAHALAKVDQADVLSLYHAASIAGELGGCRLPLSKAHEVLTGVFVMESPPVQDVYYAAVATHFLGQTLDLTNLFTALLSALKKDDTPAALGYALHTAMLLDNSNAEVILRRVEDLIGQADEVDGQFLQFEGGISVTAIATSGIYLLADKVNKSPAIKADEAVKLTNYLLSRKGVRLVRPAAHLLRALTVLTKNKFHKPVSISLESSVAMSSAEPIVRVRVCDVLGESVGALSVTVDAAEHVPTRATVLSKQPMQVAQRQDNVYELALIDGQTKRERGFYKLTVSAGSSTDKRLIGGLANELSVKVMTAVQIDDMQVAVFDREQTNPTNPHKLKQFAKLGQVLDADYHQKVSMKFAIREKSGGAIIKVHQAFVIFTHKATNQEIVFVAEPEKGSGTYKFEVDLQKAAKDFDQLSGGYSIRLLVGDAVVANPVDWAIADAKLKFAAVDEPTSEAKPSMYKPLAPIKHEFRQPDKRPAQFVSDVFTVACLMPLLVMFVMWLRVGINFGNMPVSLFTLGFHLGLGGVLGLYLMFWLRLNMFTTLKYLAGVGGITFLCANRMLRAMADKRKMKQE